jgi:holo-[acyl-carrier protein] synthase
MYMSIIGHGIDVVDLERFKQLLTEESGDFLARCFLQTELELVMGWEASKRLESLAGKFAAKEAVAKALGTGFDGNIGPQHIAILNDQAGAPQVVLNDAAAELAAELGISIWRVSISHAGPVAIASALALRAEATSLPP